jgi:hypothetical protein
MAKFRSIPVTFDPDVAVAVVFPAAFDPVVAFADAFPVAGLPAVMAVVPDLVAANPDVSFARRGDLFVILGRGFGDDYGVSGRRAFLNIDIVAGWGGFLIADGFHSATGGGEKGQAKSGVDSVSANFS